MKFNRNLMTGMIGLAMLAAPITAAAKDNDSGRNNSHQEQAESRHEAPARNMAPQARSDFHEQRSERVENRNFAPAPAPRNDFREQRSERVENRNFAPAPANVNRNESQRAARIFIPAPDPAHRD